MNTTNDTNALQAHKHDDGYFYVHENGEVTDWGRYGDEAEANDAITEHLELMEEMNKADEELRKKGQALVESIQFRREKMTEQLDGERCIFCGCWDQEMITIPGVKSDFSDKISICKVHRFHRL